MLLIIIYEIWRSNDIADAQKEDRNTKASIDDAHDLLRGVDVVLIAMRCLDGGKGKGRC